MTETECQELYNKYVSTSSEEEKKKLADVLHRFIYFYPVKRFQVDADVSSDFYIYMSSKIEGIFEKYPNDGKYNFITFLSVYLRSSFYRFLSKKKVIKEDLVHDWNDSLIDSRSSVYYVEQRNDSLWNEIRRTIYNIMNALETNDNMMIRLYFGFPLLLTHFRELLLRHKSFIIFSDYRKYLEDIEKKIQKNKKKKSIIENKLSKLQENLTDGKIKDIKEYHKKQEEYLSDLYKLNKTVTLKTVAYFIQETLNYVFRKMKKNKENIRKAIIEQKSSLLKKLGYQNV